MNINNFGRGFTPNNTSQQNNLKESKLNNQNLGSQNVGANDTAPLGTPSYQDTVYKNTELVELADNLKTSESLAKQIATLTGTLKTNAQKAFKTVSTKIMNIITTAVNGAKDFLIGNGEKQQGLGICYVLSGLFSTVKAGATSVMSKIKQMFSVNQDGQINVKFAKDDKGNAFASGNAPVYDANQDKWVSVSQAKIQNQVITSSDLYALLDNGLATADAESSADILGLAYGKLRLARGNSDVTDYNPVINLGGLYAASAAESGVPVDFLESIGVGPGIYLKASPSGSANGNLENYIKTMRGNGFILTAGTNPSAIAAKSVDNSQIVSSHAYSILGIDTATNKIIIHNPWGVDSAESEAISSMMNNKIDVNNDGTFTISTEDFNKYFNTLQLTSPTGNLSKALSLPTPMLAEQFISEQKINPIYYYWQDPTAKARVEKLLTPDANGVVIAESEAQALLLDYNENGLKAGLSPTPTFNETTYLLNNPDVASDIQAGKYKSGYEHYVKVGAKEVLANEISLLTDASKPLPYKRYLSELNMSTVPTYVASNPLLNVDYYFANKADAKDWATKAVADRKYPDLETAALAHYNLYGSKAKAPPNPDFNEASYLKANPDVASAVRAGKYKSGFDHYQKVGYREILTNYLLKSQHPELPDINKRKLR